MPLPLYYYLSITAVNILMSWALYLPYRVAHLHFITVANMAISGYTAGWLVMSLHVPFGWALVAGFVLGGLIGWVVSLFIGDAPTFAVVIVGFTFIFITRTVIQNLPAVGGTMGMFGLPNIGEARQRTAGSSWPSSTGWSWSRGSSSIDSITPGSEGRHPPSSWTRTWPPPWA